MPCDVGDAIMCYIKEQAKMTKVVEEDEEKWVKTDAKEVVIKDYAIVRKFEIHKGEKRRTN
jgi:ribosomal protein S19